MRKCKLEWISRSTKKVKPSNRERAPAGGQISGVKLHTRGRSKSMWWKKIVRKSKQLKKTEDS
ncbi:predicted protein [Sclerotinia sclerotiorum 1980 UF-70]|uniref:Uncharacterized protein n=1 Tax=Sclerotinia sclerotiorum (strain ATCC 18683 / 1980 / Ss-1) TaxID=665079 RepID=A7EX79_SCLS1|nr:predicted protein [Sclerotinia sclerotiorum 1980 UF-70]EDN94071.1 predicted protein [Sclerotinia sclerotiorum 1980 UF-70]